MTESLGRGGMVTMEADNQERAEWEAYERTRITLSKELLGYDVPDELKNVRLYDIDGMTEKDYQMGRDDLWDAAGNIGPIASWRAPNVREMNLIDSRAGGRFELEGPNGQFIAATITTSDWRSAYQQAQDHFLAQLRREYPPPEVTNYDRNPEPGPDPSNDWLSTFNQETQEREQDKGRDDQGRDA
jgi:hypothetical protein